MSRKNCNDTIGNRTHELIAQCLNQLRHQQRTPPHPPCCVEPRPEGQRLNRFLVCEISGSGSEVIENCTLLGRYAASRGNFLPTFRNNLSVPYSGTNNHYKLWNNPEWSSSQIWVRRGGAFPFPERRIG
jgi:hypothetical protein